ncbi:MAG: helix-turn-helix transcriptional regulator, partial [Anaerolineales bacterium]
MTHSLGQQLKEERESQRLSLEKVFEATRIRIQYLQALEADDLSVMPSPVQARGYLRNYAEYLGLDVEQMLTEMRASSRPEIPGEVIGPADEFAAIPQQEPEPVETRAASPAAAVSEIIAETAPAEEPVSAPSLTVPVKAKPARRKKADGSTTKTRAATAEPTTTRRGRKKMEPEP